MFLVYCAIRRVMDYSTGIAGVARRISEQMLKEVLYVAPCRGRHESGSPTRQRIRSVVDRLITLGLLVPAGAMVYQLPLALRDGLSKGSATEQQPDQQPYEQPSNNLSRTSNDAASSDSLGTSETGSGSAEIANSNLPPISGKAKDLPPKSPKGDRAPKAPKFDPLTVCPVNVSPQTWADWCQHRTEIKKPLTAKSCEHQAKQLAGHSRADTVIENSISNGWTGLFPEKVTHASSPQPGRQGALSAVDRVKQAIADREAQPRPAGSPLAQDDRDVREPLDGEFRRVG
ncbi:hypothetical protein D3C78_607550 [compost metagenome]